MSTALQDQQSAEARILTPAAADLGGTLSGSGAQGYWRKPDGTITFGAYTVNGMRAYTRKKFMPLMDYAQFVNDLDKSKRFDPMTDPYRPLLEAGGIKEFGLAQIVELGWHRKPHRILQAAIDRLKATGMTDEAALEAVMPQLKGFVRVDVPCLLCHGRVFNAEDERSRHEVVHKEDVQNRRLSDSIGQALAGGQAASTETMAPILKMLAEAIQALSTSQADMQANLANTHALVSRVAASTEAPPKK